MKTYYEARYQYRILPGRWYVFVVDEKDPNRYDTIDVRLLEKRPDLKIYGFASDHDVFEALMRERYSIGAVKLTPFQVSDLRYHREVSGSNGETYIVVQRADGDWRCSCPDHMYRQRACKHIQEARRDEAS